VLTFAEAARTVIPFGDYKGQTIDHVAQTDEGLLWLDEIVDWPNLFEDLSEAIQTYLTDRAISGELKSILDK